MGTVAHLAGGAFARVFELYAVHLHRASALAGRCAVRVSDCVDRDAGHRPAAPFEGGYRWTIGSLYAMQMQRHMHEYGTTLEQFSWVKVAAAHHAQHNPNAMLRKRLTLDDVMASPVLSAPLRRHDCCVISDGGGALILAPP